MIANVSSIIDTNLNLYTCGSNKYGQLGIGNVQNTYSFTKANISNVHEVSIGEGYTFVLKEDSTLWGCGVNNNYQLGLGYNSEYIAQLIQIMTDIKSVACGGDYTFVIKNDNSVWACGNNNNGQLGLGDTVTRTVFTQVNIDDVKQIVCGYHTFILKNDGTLWSCGYNNFGQLGLGDTTNRTTFTKIDISNVKRILDSGFHHTFIEKEDNTIWACGFNANGQLGLGDTTNRTTFTKIDITDVKQLGCGYGHTLILKNDGTVWVCGLRYFGSLGITGSSSDILTFTQLTTDVSDIYVNGYSNLLRKTDGTFYGCGNMEGSLGLGDSTRRNELTLIPINIDFLGFTASNIIYPEARYKLINIFDISNKYTSNNKYLIVPDYKCKVFRYKTNKNISVYYTMNQELTIDSDLGEWALDKSYIATDTITIALRETYFAKKILIVCDDIDNLELEVWAELGDDIITIGKINSSSIKDYNGDVKNKLLITEDGYMYTNDMYGNYIRLNGLYKEVLFEGSINAITDYELGDTTQYKMFSFILNNGTYNISEIVTSLNTNSMLSFGDASITFSIDSTTLHVTSINGLTITNIIGIK